MRIWEALCRLSTRDIRTLWPTQTWQEEVYFLKEIKQRANCNNGTGRVGWCILHPGPSLDPAEGSRADPEKRARLSQGARSPLLESRQVLGGGSMDEVGIRSLGRSTVLRPCQARAASPGLASGSRSAVTEPDQHLQPSLMRLSSRPMRVVGGANGGLRWSLWRFIIVY